MMGRPPDARVTTDSDREICERTGSTAVVDGSITNIATQYVLGLRATNCCTGASLPKCKCVRAAKSLGSLPWTRRHWKCARSWASLLTTVVQYSTPLAEATTTSFEALKAYSEGWKVHASSGAAAAVPLFQRATEIDPQFAMAHAVLGRMYADIDEPDHSAESPRKA
jgi:eukaryotic-like serine/threonine-protein kinase